jgi:hypothetical protein
VLVGHDSKLLARICNERDRSSLKSFAQAISMVLRVSATATATTDLVGHATGTYFDDTAQRTSEPDAGKHEEEGEGSEQSFFHGCLRGSFDLNSENDNNLYVVTDSLQQI